MIPIGVIIMVGIITIPIHGITVGMDIIMGTITITGTIARTIIITVGPGTPVLMMAYRLKNVTGTGAGRAHAMNQS